MHALLAAVLLAAPTFRLTDAVVVKARLADESAARRLAVAAADLTNVICHVAGVAPEIREEGQALPSPKAAIYLGPTEAARAAGIDGEGMRNGDWRVKTLPGAAYLYGKTPWGAQNAVTEFAERLCGHYVVSVDGHDVYDTDPQFAVPVADVLVKPAIYSTELYHGMYDGRRYPKTKAMWERFSRMGRGDLSPDLEGRYRVSSTPGGRCHTQFFYVPPKLYAAEHPEYYAMGPDGKRSSAENAGGGLCLTNPDVRRICLESLRRFADKDRRGGAKAPPCVYDLSQLDNVNHLCLCDRCREVIAKYNRVPGGHAEGGDAGLQLEFANSIAREIRRTHPDVQIRIFAYVSSACPPKPDTIAPEPNVVIWWCDVYSKSDHTVPLSATGHFNRDHAMEIDGWLELTRNVMVWDYRLSGRYYEFADSYPEFSPDAMKSDADFFGRRGVPCYFLEMYPGQPLYELEHFMARHLLVDPKADVDALLRTFCRGYGAGAGEMYEALQRLRREIARRPAPNAIAWHSRTLPWLDRATMEGLAGAARRAMAAEHDDVPKSRVARVLLATLKALMKILAAEPAAKDRLDEICAEYLRVGDYVARTAFMEPDKRKTAAERVHETVDLLTLKFSDLPPELAAVPKEDLICIDWHAAGAKVADTLSERGFGIRAEDVGDSLPCGVYDEQDKSSFGFSVKRDGGGAYRWHRLGRVHVGRISLFWFPGSWKRSFSLRDRHILADGLPTDPNWYELWASVRFDEGGALIDRLAMRRVPPPSPHR